MPYGLVFYSPTVLYPMVLESYVLWSYALWSCVLWSYCLMSYMVLESYVLWPYVLWSYVLWSCVLWSYCLMPYGPTVLCRQWDIKPGLHSMQKAQFNTKHKIGFISLLSIKINVTLCMLSVKDPREYGCQHTSLATVVFNLVPASAGGGTMIQDTCTTALYVYVP